LIFEKRIKIPAYIADLSIGTSDGLLKIRGKGYAGI
jgi:hypothetical protein